jgi:putative salt-induced outer membrane protein YdiY
MHVSTTRLALGLIGIIAGVMPVQAQDDSDEDRVFFTIDAGFAATSGNSDITTITAGQAFGYQSGRFLFSQAFDMLFNKSDGVTTAEAYKGNLRGNRFFGEAERLALFLDLRGSRNALAGIARRFEQALGVSYDVVKTAKDVVALEGAATLVQQRGTDGLDNNFPAALLAANYVHNFTEAANFLVRGEYIPSLENSDDYRVNGEAKLAAPISGKIAIVISYLVRYDNVPEPGFGTTDRFFTSGIQLRF